MARIKRGVFSWEDVLAQRYQSLTLVHLVADKPAPLPRSRRIAEVKSQTQIQLQCQLLTRLSPELRLMIWEYVQGGHRLHIIQRSRRRLGHVVCPVNDHEICKICQGGGISQPAKVGDLRDSRGNGILLGLALTCRQIYHESIHLLYTLNTFEFSNPWSLPYLRPTILADHWNCIQNVELRWSFHGHWLPTKDPVRAVYVSAGRVQWHETCHALASLPALKTFVLVLGSRWFSEPVERLPVFLDPLSALHISSSPSSSPLRNKGWISRIGPGPGSKGKPAARFVESSSDEESSSLDSSSSSDSETSLPSCSFARASWELRLQGQSYGMPELSRLGLNGIF
ncbi:hypothetical protein N7495_008322 [Penicillium taxi]|uniref:uncharacterized protein n=1 Tax=Penicillium taxi TaxID=168475 RepID=UPI0025455F8B|nr:uncharacterized protein N7495_008322 [Penicillium taxi]KAJ5888281.1 hypothetical protein N7495_008322 [Penicillium taxi]